MIHINNKSNLSTWNYSQKENKLWRVKTADADSARITHYVKEATLGSGYSGIVYSYKEVEGLKHKAVKYSKGMSCSVKGEYEISQMWAKGSEGLLLRPKAYFTETFKDFYIMNQYEGPLIKFFHNLI